MSNFYRLTEDEQTELIKWWYWLADNQRSEYDQQVAVQLHQLFIKLGVSQFDQLSIKKGPCQYKNRTCDQRRSRCRSNKRNDKAQQLTDSGCAEKQENQPAEAQQYPLAGAAARHNQPLRQVIGFDIQFPQDCAETEQCQPGYVDRQRCLVFASPLKKQYRQRTDQQHCLDVFQQRVLLLDG